MVGPPITVRGPEAQPGCAATTGSARWVKRQRCGDCGHLKSEHIIKSVCHDFYWETILLPVCIDCGKNVCDDVEDQLCQKCWKRRLSPNI